MSPSRGETNREHRRREPQEVWGLVSPRNRVRRFDETTSGYATSPLSLVAAAAGCVSLREWCKGSSGALRVEQPPHRTSASRRGAG